MKLIIVKMLAILIAQQVFGSFAIIPVSMQNDYDVDVFTNELKNIFDNNERIREDLTSVFIIDSTENVNVNKIILDICSDLDVVIEGVYSEGPVPNNLKIDYLILLHDNYYEVRRFAIFNVFMEFFFSFFITQLRLFWLQNLLIS